MVAILLSAHIFSSFLAPVHSGGYVEAEILDILKNQKKYLMQRGVKKVSPTRPPIFHV